MERGKYIVFEGVDGSGKTTQSKSLVERLKSQGIDAIWTREPGSPLIELNVRDLVLSHQKIDPNALELLFMADRAEHTSKIKDLLAQGKWVISDRSFMSGLAYGIACGNESFTLQNIMRYAIKQFPDYIFYMHVPVEECLRRRDTKTGTREESKGGEFLSRVIQNFVFLSQQLPLGALGHTGLLPNISTTLLNATGPIQMTKEMIDRCIIVDLLKQA